MRLLGVTIPDEKKIPFALTHIYGVGRTLASKTIKEVGIDPTTRAKDITPDQANAIKEYITKNFKVEGELRQDIKASIGRLKEIGSYRGTRHVRKLPTNGQRTKTNSRTVRGNVRKTAGSGKRKVDLK
jgi:small subunit ribosomal protein S13